MDCNYNSIGSFHHESVTKYEIIFQVLGRSIGNDQCQITRTVFRNLAEKVGCPAGTIAKIVNHINYRKMCAKWVPKLLTQQQKDVRREICSTLLRERRGAEENVFPGTVTGDESWIHHYQPESRRLSMEWTHPGSPASKEGENCLFSWKD